MGHLLHGTSLALANQMERYGLRTISGSTGGDSVEAYVKLSRLAATAKTLQEGMASVKREYCPVCRRWGVGSSVACSWALGKSWITDDY